MGSLKEQLAKFFPNRVTAPASQAACEFDPKTERIGRLAKKFPYVQTDLAGILTCRTNIYIDYGNVRPWSERLGWHVSTKRLFQLFASFNCPKELKFYYGTLADDPESKKFIEKVKGQGYSVTTRAVKKIRISIDASSVSSESPDILRNFIARPLLDSLSVKQIEELNGHLKALNNQGTMFFEDSKCNFDVEIGTDMLEDMRSGGFYSVELRLRFCGYDRETIGSR